MDQNITVVGSIEAGYDKILTAEALAFVADLHRRFDPVRRELLDERARRQRLIDQGWTPGFLSETASIREGGRGWWRHRRTIWSTAAARSPGRSTAR